MYRGLVWLVASCFLLLAGAYMWTHRQHVVQAVAAPAGLAEEPQTHYDEETQAQQMVTITGPLADYMSRQKPGQMEKLLPANSDNSSGSPPSASASSPRAAYQPSEADHVGDSPVGTSTPILRKTFPVVALVNLPFDIPPHAADPHLHGTYRSFLKGSNADADVEFMLMNQPQYTDLLNGQPGDAVLSADDSHNQEVNITLPPTFGEPARYYLVFRNNSPAAAKKLVQADFRVDF
jgi:hypothetical protein